MDIKELIEGYYAGTLTDAEEEQLEMLMLAGHPDIPEGERRLYLGLANIPQGKVQVRRTRKRVRSITSIAASVALILGLGYYIYAEHQRQMVTQQEILEMAMGNMGRALHQSDTSRQQLASIINSIDADTTKNKEKEEINNPEDI